MVLSFLTVSDEMYTGIFLDSLREILPELEEGRLVVREQSLEFRLSRLIPAFWFLKGLGAMLEVVEPICINILGLRMIGGKQVGDEVSF